MYVYNVYVVTFIPAITESKRVKLCTQVGTFK